MDDTLAHLEQQFKDEFGTTPNTGGSSDGDSQHDLSDKKKALDAMLAKIDSKSDVLEADVKQKLESLKTLKATIEDELTKLKSLETAKATIESEKAKITELEEKQSSLDSEIQAIEESTKNLGV